MLTHYEKQDLLSLAYYRAGASFTGSGGGMRFKIETTGEDKKNPSGFLVTTWPEPFSFEATDPTLMESFSEEFSDDALARIAEKLSSLCSGSDT